MDTRERAKKFLVLHRENGVQACSISSSVFCRVSAKKRHPETFLRWISLPDCQL